ncbi:MAG: alpha/beta hydrolase [Planctomycetes bacterium]|nr:alpha/beta hydrolase [Planctomycetota bacterium]
MNPQSFSIACMVALLAALPLYAGDGKIKSEKKIVYGKGAEVDLELDLAMPASGAGPFPAVVCIHGGGWRGGSRQSLNGLTELLARNGFVAVTVSYRFAPKYRFPAQIEDCKAAVRWLRANAKKYKINPDRVGAVGFSAGGHLACLLGAATEAAGLEGKGGNPSQSTRVQAVVSYFGPTDFTVKTWANDVENIFFIPLLGGRFEDKKDDYRKCSPLIYCRKDCPPFLFFHGAKDVLVGIEHSRKMSKKLTDLGVSAKLVTLPDAGHGWGGAKLTTTLNQTVHFFKDKLQK